MSAPGSTREAAGAGPEAAASRVFHRIVGTGNAFDGAHLHGRCLFQVITTVVRDGLVVLVPLFWEFIFSFFTTGG